MLCEFEGLGEKKRRKNDYCRRALSCLGWNWASWLGDVISAIGGPGE